MEQPIPAGMLQAVHDLLKVAVLPAVGPKPGAADLQTLTSLLQRFDKAAAYAHHFADGFHLQPKLAVGAFEFIKVPARYFYDHIIKRRLKVSRCCFGDLVFYFIQVITYGKLCCYLCDGVTGRL